MTALEDRQREVCDRFGVSFLPPEAGTKVGIARQTLTARPLNALRHPPQADTCGWYIWGGELSSDSEFFQPLHVEHLEADCPELLEFLALPPGWRVLLATDHEDVWYDETLLAV